MSTLNFDDMMVKRRGYSRMDLNRCLNDRTALFALQRNAEADNAQFDLPTDPEGYAKPHFVLDGERLNGVHDWGGLYAVLKNRFKPDPEEQ